MRLAPAFALAAAFLTAACGFQPLYDGGADGAVRAGIAGVEVGPIADRLGQEMRNRLIERMGSGAHSDYRLDVVLNTETEGFGIRSDAAATQEQMILTAVIRLTPIGKDMPVIEDTLRARTSYDLVLSDYATVAEREDAARRLAFELAERIHRRLALYFNQKDKEKTGR